MFSFKEWQSFLTYNLSQKKKMHLFSEGYQRKFSTSQVFLWIVSVSLFNGISTFVGYSILKPYL